ncbi:unnamed protein product [Parnassius mnemosyne]|uniref:Transposase n=1 Tax=Parnassius mnemosyne TaxID=213953 RepID=A0AAV1KTJ6_9NEOP
MSKRMVLQGQSRLFVVRLRDYFERECQNGGPLLPLSHVLARVADALGISCGTVSRITFEAYGRSGMEENKLRTPKRKRRSCTVTAIDNINVEAIKHHINNYYVRKEMPTLRKVPKEGKPKMRLVKVVMDPESDCSSLSDSNKVQKHRDDLDDTNFKYNSNMQLDNISLDWDSEDPCYLSNSEDDFITKDTS